MMDMKLVKSIRAVSPLIATILLIAITVAGGLVTYALFTSTAGVSSAKGQVSFESVDLVRTGGQLAFAATLKNAGNKPVENITVSLHQNQALSFDGVDDYVEVPDSPSLRLTTGLSMGFWIFWPIDNIEWGQIIGKGGGWGQKGYWLAAPGSRGIYFEIVNAAGNGVYFGWGPLSMNVWHYVVGTFDGSTMRLYVDGSLVGSAPQTDIGVNAAIPFRIAKHTTFGEYLQLKIDEVRIYNRALTTEEIQESYQGYSNNAGMVLYLPFDGDTKDYSGMGNDGTNHGAVSVDAPDVYVVTGGLEPGRTVAISEAVRVSGPHGKYVVGNRYSITVSAVYVDGSESAATTTVTCR